MEKKKIVQIDYEMLLDIYCKLRTIEATEKRLYSGSFCNDLSNLCDAVENQLIDSKLEDMKNESI